MSIPKGGTAKRRLELAVLVDVHRSAHFLHGRS